ncbi:metal ABC transporter ATP-binding protein [Sneathiella sp.]|jgi:zinc transport system ATP-binding protein|uniref:metal ABC transporter ATP-binding protein n=1 Tax=Sneathiella sp. TaxID=1964365 RepID=UPI0039E6ECD9
MDSLISAKHVCVSRDSQEILKDISLDIAEQDFVTIIGPNGAGKSMLLKCLMGFYPPDSGHVTMRKGLVMGYVPQRLVADPTIPITARRFLTLRRKTDKAGLKHVIEETEVADFLDKPLAVLSGGQLQRILLARALLNSPDLLVLDEPAQNLDITGQLSFYKLLDRVYRERKISVLMVSHDLHLVMSSTRNVICLAQEICCHGEPRDVTKDPEFISLFGTDMAELMASYQHHHFHDDDPHHHLHAHNFTQPHTHLHTGADICEDDHPQGLTGTDEKTAGSGTHKHG